MTAKIEPKNDGKTADNAFEINCYRVKVTAFTLPLYQPRPGYSRGTAFAVTSLMMLATQDTRDIVAAAMKALSQIWRDGSRYQKAGIMLNDFCSRPGQIDMFDETPPHANSEQLMKVVDRINSTGVGKVWFGGQGIEKGWRMKRELLSPAYTTRWNELPSAAIK